MVKGFANCEVLCFHEGQRWGQGRPCVQPSHEPTSWENPGDWGVLALRGPGKEVVLTPGLSTHHDMIKPLQAVLGPGG